MFKSPKQKELVQIGKGFTALEFGKRVGRGVVGATIPLVKPKDENQTQMIKGAVALASLYGAASYSGKNKGIVSLGLVGVALEQIGDIIDIQAAKHITKKADADMPQKFLQDAMGLGCPCNDVAGGGDIAYTPGINPNDDAAWINAGGGQWYDVDPYPFPSLNAPTIQNIELDEVYTGSENAWGSGI